MTDLISRLRALSRHEHDDLTIGDEAAYEIARLRVDHAAAMAAMDEKIERLTACLKKANDQAEHFEREWYLRGDEIVRLRQQHAQAMADMDAEIERLRELAAAPQRPPTPVGWSDTDWLAHLSTMPPIAYAVRDTLYGTSKAGVLRFCAADEPGAFAVYAHPPQQRKPLTQDEVLDMAEGCTLQFHDLLAFARAIEKFHGITGEQK
jgi:hypothetical protein